MSEALLLSTPPVDAVCVFLRTAGMLNGSLSTSPQPLTRLLLFPFCCFGCTPSSVIQQLAHRQVVRGVGGELEGKQSLVVLVVVGAWVQDGGGGGREKESLLVAPTENAKGAAVRNGVVSEGLQLESVQEPLSWNSSR